MRMVLIADCRLPIADCGLRIADCGLRIADCRLRDCQTASVRGFVVCLTAASARHTLAYTQQSYRERIIRESTS